jgi:uncharacterized protein with PQ loop repeat
MSLDWIGWVATAAFMCSYFVKSMNRVRAIQAVASLLWMSYGIAIQATPMIVANALVVATALFTMWRDQRRNSVAA